MLCIASLIRRSTRILTIDDHTSNDESFYYEDPAKLKHAIKYFSNKPKRPSPRLGPDHSKSSKNLTDEQISSAIAELKQQIANQVKLLESLEKRQKSKYNV